MANNDYMSGQALIAIISMATNFKFDRWALATRNIATTNKYYTLWWQ